MIKMQPPEQEGSHGPDLGLSLSERILAINKEEINELKRGDHIQFNATLLSMGDQSHLHHLHVFGLKKVPGFMDVEPHIHATGRYQFKVT